MCNPDNQLILALPVRFLNASQMQGNAACGFEIFERERAAPGGGIQVEASLIGRPQENEVLRGVQAQNSDDTQRRFATAEALWLYVSRQ